MVPTSSGLRVRALMRIPCHACTSEAHTSCTLKLFLLPVNCEHTFSSHCLRPVVRSGIARA
jgi:hypothetical protein